MSQVAEAAYWLRLVLTPGLGPVTLLELKERFGSPQAILQVLPTSQPQLKIPSMSRVQEYLARSEAMGARTLHWDEPEYPAQLLQIHDPPPLLFTLGDISHLAKEPLITIVGTRSASRAGLRFAQHLGESLGQTGLVTVSGLALGIDAAAHQGALKGGGATVAVQANGLDIDYPAQNRELKQAIIQSGCVITEYPPGTKPHPKRFPRRNRLLSGLSRGVVVVEAGQKSGSMITARLALEQNRELFAVPGSVEDPRSRGVNQLIRDGAQLVEEVQDILQALTWEGCVPQADTAKEAPTLAKEHYVQVLEKLPQAEGIIDTLLDGPMIPDALIRSCHLTPAELSSTLLQLELLGVVSREAGGLVSLNAK
uniref:DNA processing chain A (DprA/Smf) n=1 Tax=Magnetococcus massalia (strain MO-1) TaxID=451514 RepID=A0A1S7LN24_MAGMO|nr:DNA processing chain A (DprA/Smf) [Candidatus Magnetococcus massalia]